MVEIGAPASVGPVVWRWHFDVSPLGVTNGAGSTSAQMSITYGHRVRNRQPDGGFAGDGISPRSTSFGRVRWMRGFGHRDRREERVRVGMGRRGVQRIRGTLLDQLPEIHHRDPVAHVAHDGEVVGDEEERDPELVLEVFEQVDGLRLRGDVERADRLVHHHELRIGGERAAIPARWS